MTVKEMESRSGQLLRLFLLSRNSNYDQSRSKS
jgi:hypothetical protein